MIAPWFYFVKPWLPRPFAPALFTALLAATPAILQGRAGEPADPGERAVVILRAPGAAEVFIPKGAFVMGSDATDIEVAIDMCKKEPMGGDDYCEKNFASELEAHPVMLSAYYIDRTEVTVSAFMRCVELGRCVAPPYAAGGERFNRSNYPVTLVSWEDANAYCRFKSGRLPTEAEWERAARGATRRRFPWGTFYNKAFANHGALAIDDTDDSDGFSELAPVGSFPLGRTPDGIDDMAGNVEEWVLDAIDDLLGAHYPAASEVNPKGAPGGALRVVRGGSFESGAAWLRGATRGFRAASTRSPRLGFRCVHPVDEGV